MSLYKVSTTHLDKAHEYFSSAWAEACERWGLKPVPLWRGLLLWLGWTGLTWLAFMLSLAIVEVGERGDVSLVDGLLLRSG